MISSKETILMPELYNALMADSLPVPGPFTFTFNVFIPYPTAILPTDSAVTCAENGVDFLDPLKPCLPEADQNRTSPSFEVMVMIVLLKVAWIYAIPSRFLLLVELSCLSFVLYIGCRFLSCWKFCFSF